MSIYTKKAIMDSFVKMLSQKPFDKITIKDIIEDCGLNRSTFYYYYDDIYALLKDVFQTELDRITKEHAIYTSWQSGFLESARFVLENKKAVYHIYNSIGREPLEKYLYQITWDLMVGFVRQEAQGLQVSEEDINYIASFYQFALSGFIFQWLQNGMKEDPNLAIQKLGDIFDGSIKNALLRCHRRQEKETKTE